MFSNDDNLSDLQECFGLTMTTSVFSNKSHDNSDSNPNSEIAYDSKSDTKSDIQNEEKGLDQISVDLNTNPG